MRFIVPRSTSTCQYFILLKCMRVFFPYQPHRQRTARQCHQESGKNIRKERYSGACSRSFYVGDAVTEEDIKGEFKHGILKLFVPKKEAKPAVEDHKYIAIEG